MLTLDKIYHAAYVLRQVARKTDLIAAPALADDCELYLKTENLQVTGSFKVWLWPPPAAASRASSACPTARPSARWRPPRPTAPR